MNKKVKLKFILFNIVLLSSVLCAQKFEVGNYYDQSISLDYSNIKNEVTKTENLTTDLLINSGITVLSTGLLFLIDNQIRNEIQSKSNNNVFLDIGHEYGETYYAFGLSGALYFTQFVLNDNTIGNTGKVLFESLVVGGLLSISLKYIFGRSRPYLDEGNAKFNWFETNNIYNSLPSGHVITAFTLSTVLSESIDNTYATIALYGLASLTTYQRVSSDNHWFSDAFLGGAIGVIVGKYFSDLSEGNKLKSGTYNITPFWNKNYYGVSLIYNFY